MGEALDSPFLALETDERSTAGPQKGGAGGLVQFPSPWGWRPDRPAWVGGFFASQPLAIHPALDTVVPVAFPQLCPAVAFPVPVSDPMAGAFHGVTESEAVAAFTANAPATMTAAIATSATAIVVFTRVHLLRYSSGDARGQGDIWIFHDDSRMSRKSPPNWPMAPPSKERVVDPRIEPPYGSTQCARRDARKPISAVKPIRYAHPMKISVAGIWISPK